MFDLAKSPYLVSAFHHENIITHKETILPLDPQMKRNTEHSILNVSPLLKLKVHKLNYLNTHLIKISPMVAHLLYTIVLKFRSADPTQTYFQRLVINV